MGRLSTARIAVACSLVLPAVAAEATVLRPPPTEWTSPDGKLSLRREARLTEPIWLTLVDRARNKTHWRIKSPLGAIPADVLFTSDARFVILVNRYAGTSTGPHVLAIVGPGGETRGVFKLSDFFATTDTTLGFIGGASYVRSDRELVLVSETGFLRLIDLATGQLVELSQDARAHLREETARKYRAELNNPSISWPAAYALALIGDIQCIPKLLQIIQTHRRPEGFVEAYCQLLGDDATYEIERQARKALNTNSLYVWMRAMPAGPKGRAALRRLILEDVRFAESIEQTWGIVTADDVRRHPEWVFGSNRSLKGAAAHALAATPMRADLPLLRHLLNTGNDDVRRDALRALIKINPRGLRDMLTPLRSPCGYPDDVTVELARLGDVEAQTQLRNELLQRVAYPRLLGRTCRLIAANRYAWGPVALAKYAEHPDPRLRVEVQGALAAIGSPEALRQIRKTMLSGDQEARLDAIEWLVMLGDRASTSELVRMTLDADAQIASAARVALEQFTRTPPWVTSVIHPWPTERLEPTDDWLW